MQLKELLKLMIGQVLYHPHHQHPKKKYSHGHQTKVKKVVGVEVGVVGVEVGVVGVGVGVGQNCWRREIVGNRKRGRRIINKVIMMSFLKIFRVKENQINTVID